MRIMNRTSPATESIVCQSILKDPFYDTLTALAFTFRPVLTSMIRFIVPKSFGTQSAQLMSLPSRTQCGHPVASSRPGSQHHWPSTTNLYSYRPGGRSRSIPQSPSGVRCIRSVCGFQSLKVPARKTLEASAAWQPKDVLGFTSSCLCFRSISRLQPETKHFGCRFSGRSLLGDVAAQNR